MPEQKLNEPFYKIHLAEIDNDVFSVLAFEGEAEISTLFEYRMVLVSSDPQIDSSKILNKSATFTFIRSDQSIQNIHGIISQIEQFGHSRDHIFYKLILVPQLWKSKLIFQNMVYQNLDIKDLTEQVLKDSGLGGSDYNIDLKNSYPKHEFIVQFRETNFNFLNRRLEHYGIYYYFDHSGEKEVVCFTDDNSKIPNINLSEDIGYNENQDRSGEGESILELSSSEKIVTGTVQLKDYNYLFPEKQLVGQSQITSNLPGMYYDYGDNFENVKDAEALAKVRNQEFLSQSKIFKGRTNCRLFLPGFIFKMDNHYRNDWNGEYVITKVYQEGSQRGQFVIPQRLQVSESIFECRFEAIPVDIDYRPLRKTPIPKISGVISAKVDAAGNGQYAAIDDHSRYKVKLDFDLSDKNNGDASHNVRMTQHYAGGNYGIHFPLHKNAEVLLTFIDGNPDRPIIASAVPNPSNSSPVKGANQTQSVIRTAANNEIVIEDSSGGEQIHINQACGNEIFMKAEGPDIEIKQKCGNQILMKEAEGIHIKDKYGNEIKLDSVAGTLTLKSPTHNSSIVLGKSEERHTDSNLKIVALGMKDEHVVGPVKVKWAGISQEWKGGAVQENFMGLKSGNFWGVSIEHKRAKEIKDNEKEIETKAKQHIKLNGGPGKESELWLSESLAALRSKNKGQIEINDDGIKIWTKKTIKIIGDGDIVLASKGEIQIGNGMKVDKNGICHFSHDIVQPSVNAKK